jgi:homoserine kinase type II
MAVYTQLEAEALEALIACYDVGSLVSAKGIAEGVSNSNWLVETTGRDGAGGRYILTMYERRIDLSDLPFFLGLLDHLSERGCKVPRTIHDRDGAASREVAGKVVALIEFLPGISPDRPTPAQARAVGAALAQVHLAALDFGKARPNGLGPAASARTLADCGEAALARIDPDLPRAAGLAQEVRRAWPSDLPRSVIHSDLFPDNVLMLGAQVSGMIDFYFACTDAMAYDLAVTHAAWSFDKAGERFAPAVGAALLAGYEAVRPLAPAERAALPLLARGAALRFVASRAEDWIETPAGALVARKDPLAFLRRHDFYAREGKAAFA